MRIGIAVALLAVVELVGTIQSASADSSLSPALQPQVVSAIRRTLNKLPSGQAPLATTLQSTISGAGTATINVGTTFFQLAGQPPIYIQGGWQMTIGTGVATETIPVSNVTVPTYSATPNMSTLTATFANAHSINDPVTFSLQAPANMPNLVGPGKIVFAGDSATYGGGSGNFSATNDPKDTRFYKSVPGQFVQWLSQNGYASTVNDNFILGSFSTLPGLTICSNLPNDNTCADLNIPDPRIAFNGTVTSGPACWNGNPGFPSIGGPAFNFDTSYNGCTGDNTVSLDFTPDQPVDTFAFMTVGYSGLTSQVTWWVDSGTSHTEAENGTFLTQNGNTGAAITVTGGYSGATGYSSLLHVSTVGTHTLHLRCTNGCLILGFYGWNSNIPQTLVANAGWSGSTTCGDNVSGGPCGAGVGGTVSPEWGATAFPFEPGYIPPGQIGHNGWNEVGADAVFLELGNDDLSNNGTTPSNYQTQLTTLGLAITSRVSSNTPTSNVWITTLLPNATANARNNYSAQRAYVQAQREVANLLGFRVIDLYGNLQDFYAAQLANEFEVGVSSPTAASNHPNNTMYADWLKILLQEITKGAN